MSLRFGGFSDRDATLDFYLRVNSAIQPGSVVLDLGAGRGGWADTAGPFKSSVLMLRGKAKEVIAADIDPVVLQNPNCDRTLLIENGRVPLEDGSVDLIVSDFVLEHVSDPASFVSEVHRLLRPGGLFCARTPHHLHYIAVLSRLVPSRMEDALLSRAQPGRKSEDVFPKVFRMNSPAALNRLFAGWEDFTFVYRTEPSYHFGSRFVLAALDFLHRIMPAAFSGSLMVFKRKSQGATAQG